MNTYTKNVLKIINEIEVPHKLTASSPAKISCASNNSFSMLAGPKFGCPGATQACESCYAMKGHHHYPTVQSALAKNWLLIKSLEKNKNSKSAVQHILNIIPAKANIFRIHESSDFFSQWYVDVWANVVKQKPQTLFWTYTRTFNLCYAELTRRNNFVLWASADDYNADEARKFINRFKNNKVKLAYGPWPHNRKLPANSIVCPVTTKKLDMTGACERCKLCVTKNKTSKNVVFLRH